MNINDLFELEPGASISIFNNPFSYVGHADIELDGGQTMRWLYDVDGRMLSVIKADDELILFESIDEILEPENETILYQGKEYEFSYEDAGNVKGIEGDATTEEEDRFMFSDYHGQNGGIARLISNSNTGEDTHYIGEPVSEDDLSRA
jgi:hypothetical protein